MDIDFDKMSAWLQGVESGEEYPDVMDSDLTDDEARWLLAATQQAAARKLSVPIESITVSREMLQ